MHAEALQVAAVVAAAIVWLVADGFSRRMRRQAKRYRAQRGESSEERRELMDANALSASDD